MKLVAYLIPDDFEDWKMPQGIEFRYKVEHVPGGRLKDIGPWLALGETFVMALWRRLGGGK